MSRDLKIFEITQEEMRNALKAKADWYDKKIGAYEENIRKYKDLNPDALPNLDSNMTSVSLDPDKQIKNMQERIERHIKSRDKFLFMWQHLAGRDKFEVFMLSEYDLSIYGLVE